MIPKITSHELNGILENANNKLENITSDIKTVKLDISKKLKIMRYEAEYIQEQMNKLQTAHKETIRPNVSGELVNVFTILNPTLSDSYEQYGCTATPQFKSTPLNVFNILATATGEAFYRDIAEVSINGVVKDEYKDILKHDSIADKELFFEELEGADPAIDISIKIDATQTLGSSLFNMIEFDPFMSGAYTIEYIRIYTSDNDEYTELNNYEYAGKMRLALDKEYSFYKVDIRIIPTFYTQVNGTNVYPVGIKHLYFYNAKFVSKSYAIAVIESSEYIDLIRDEVILKTPNEEIECSASEEGIVFYLNRTIDSATSNIVFSSVQEPSTQGNTKPISMNINTIYAKIPLANQSLVGVTFKISSKFL